MKRIINSRIAYILAGVLIGAVVFGGGAAIAAGITALPTTSRVFVNGEEIQVEAYNIHDNNFFMLRDIAAAVDFSVVWDGANDHVLIDTGKDYDPDEGSETEPPPVSGASVADRLTVINIGGVLHEITVSGDAIPGKLANGENITEDNILAVLAELEEVFPHDSPWGMVGGANYGYASSTLRMAGSGCNSWAYMTADLIFGVGAKYTKHSDLSKVKCGDVLYLNNESTGRRHWAVVMGTGLSISGNAVIYVCDGNVNGKVSWNAALPLNATIASYPGSIVYSFYTDNN